LLARRVAAHKIGQDAVNYQPQTEAEQKAVMAAAREKMATFVDMSDEDADNDLAVYEKAAKITLRDEVRKPVEVPSWSKPVERLSDDDAAVRDFKLRDENTFGTNRYMKAYGNDGVKRGSDGRILAKSTLREDADKPKPRKSEWDDARGFTVTTSTACDLPARLPISSATSRASATMQQPLQKHLRLRHPIPAQSSCRTPQRRNRIAHPAR
jgi:hypothetical protein